MKNIHGFSKTASARQSGSEFQVAIPLRRREIRVASLASAGAEVAELPTRWLRQDRRDGRHAHAGLVVARQEALRPLRHGRAQGRAQDGEGIILS